MALRAARGPAREAAPALRVSRESLAHAPDLAAWRNTLHDVHASLAPTAEVMALSTISRQVSFSLLSCTTNRTDSGVQLSQRRSHLLGCILHAALLLCGQTAL